MNLSQSYKTLQGVVVSSKTYTIPKKAELDQLSLDRARMLAMYKNFYKLRLFMSLKVWKRDHYCCIIRRRFQREDFDQRRKVVLEAASPLELNVVEELKSGELFQRILNTLAFVHNSTVHLSSEADTRRPMYFEDLKVPQRRESQIISIILEMDRSLPPQIKHDSTFKWITETTQNLRFKEQDTPKKFSKRFSGQPGLYIGARTHEITIMGLNETLGLCL